MHRDRERKISASFPTDSIPMGGVGCDRVMSSGDAHVVDLGQQRLASLPRSRGAAPCFTARGHRGSTSRRREGRRSYTLPSHFACRHTSPNCARLDLGVGHAGGQLAEVSNLGRWWRRGVVGEDKHWCLGHRRSHPSPSTRPASRGSIQLDSLQSGREDKASEVAWKQGVGKGNRKTDCSKPMFGKRQGIGKGLALHCSKPTGTGWFGRDTVKWHAKLPFCH